VPALLKETCPRSCPRQKTTVDTPRPTLSGPSLRVLTPLQEITHEAGHGRQASRSHVGVSRSSYPLYDKGKPILKTSPPWAVIRSRRVYSKNLVHETQAGQANDTLPNAPKETARAPEEVR
jgi:hypothetical protein